MKVAIIILTILAIFTNGYLTIGNTKISFNWFALADFVVLMFYFFK